MLVVFDLDGTLFQTAPCVVKAVHRLFYEQRIPRIDDEIIVQNIGKKSLEFLQAILPDGMEPKRIYQRFHEIEQEELTKNSLLFPGIKAMLHHLKLKGYLLAVCSNGSMEYIKSVLSNTGILDCFHQLYSASASVDKVEWIRRLKEKQSSIIVVGDTLSDIKAAQKNQLPSIGVSYGYAKADELLSATFLADSAENIRSCIYQAEMFYQIIGWTISLGKRIIGISGIDTSGKTMFSNQFSRFLSSVGIQNTILHIDDYHNPLSIRSQGENEIDAYYYNAFCYSRVIDEILNPLKNEGKLDKTICCLDVDTDRYSKSVHYQIEEDSILLIEGVLLFREPLASYLEASIFLDIGFDEMIRRVKVRDVPKYGINILEKYHQKYIPVQKRYLHTDHPLENSDIVIDNENYQQPIIKKHPVD